ncbi:unnamed protein product, partial [Strongylus vulgaris]
MATACSAIIFFVCTMPCTYLAIREQSTYLQSADWMIGIACIVPPSAFGIAMKVLISAELSGVGTNWSTLFHVFGHKDSAFSVGFLMVILAFETVLYFIVALYIAKVWPGEHGIPSSWYFPVETIIEKPSSESLRELDSQSSGSSVVLDESPEGAENTVRLCEVSKKYITHGARDFAVNNLTMNFYKGEITALLGENGAGKSTLIRMISGHMAPTKGRIIVDGRDISGYERVRVGICPQHNVLFPYLTVKEHLEFYAALKNPSLSK